MEFGPQVRRPKSEGRKKAEIRNPNERRARHRTEELRISAFGFRPSFGLRISAFGLRSRLAPHQGRSPFRLVNLFNSFKVSLVFLLPAIASAAGFVYETPTEFLTSGDFNGDGIPDVLVLDKATGNARVGYQNTSSNLVWSAPLPTGVPSPAALAVGHFRDTNQDAIAITAEELNRVYLLRLSNPSNAPAPATLTPHGLGPDYLVGLSAPFGNVGSFDSLAIGSSDNNTNFGSALLELLGFVGDALSVYQDSLAQQSYLATGNSLILGSDPITYAAAMQRGSNDTFAAFSPATHFGAVLSRPGLQPGTAYVFGKFNNEALPRFLFYVPGQSNIIVQPASGANGNYVLNAGITVSLNEAVQGVFYVSRGTDGVALIQFGDGVQGLTLPGGSPVLSITYRSGGGSAGNVFTGIVPLGSGNFAVMDAPPGSADRCPCPGRALQWHNVYPGERRQPACSQHTVHARQRLALPSRTIRQQ